MSAVATVYLTDGIDRLHLPGRTSQFRLRDDWVCEGTPVEWYYDGPGLITLAGFEIVRWTEHGSHTVAVEQFDDYSVELVRPGDTIRVRPYISDPDIQDLRVVGQAT